MDNGTQKTTIYLPADLYAMLRNRAKNRGVSIQDVIREALTTAMEVEDGGFQEQIDRMDAKWNAEQERMRVELDALIAKHGALAAGGASEPAPSAKIKGMKVEKAPADEAASKSEAA